MRNVGPRNEFEAWLWLIALSPGTWLLIIVAMLAVATGARSQTLNLCLENNSLAPCRTEPTNYDDGSEVGRAMAICAKHEVFPNFVYPEGGTPAEYDKDWEACYRVRQEWQTSEAAKRIEAERRQVERDRAFVNAVRDKIEKGSRQ